LRSLASEIASAIVGIFQQRYVKRHGIAATDTVPFWWMALVVSVVAYLVAGVIFAIITALASGERVR
jgi:uncharacterized membrane protein YdbT with pleckstrin-like domain